MLISKLEDLNFPLSKLFKCVYIIINILHNHRIYLAITVQREQHHAPILLGILLCLLVHYVAWRNSRAT